LKMVKRAVAVAKDGVNFPGTGRGQHHFAQATRFAGAGRGPVSFSSYTLTTSQPSRCAWVTDSRRTTCASFSRLKWSGAEDLQQPQPAWRNAAARAADDRRVGSGEGTHHETEAANADLGHARAARRSDSDLSAWLVRLLPDDWQLGLRHWRREAVLSGILAVSGYSPTVATLFAASGPW